MPYTFKSKKMTEELSIKFKILSIFSMIMVVYIHAYSLNVSFENVDYAMSYKTNSFIQNFISQGITRCAVPLFFLMSGFLFFQRFIPSINCFVYKIRKRIKTLLFPYLFWSLYGLFLYYILQLMPVDKSFFTNELIKNYSCCQFFDTLFFHPIPYQFWFIRDLMLLVIVSPLIFLLIKIYYIVIPILFVLWVSPTYFAIVSIESILFFFLGAFFALKKVKHQNVFLTKYWLVLLLVWFSFILLKFLCPYVWIHKVQICLGILTVWYGYDNLNNRLDFKKISNAKIMPFSFFIYAFHEPLLTIVKKGLYYFFHNNEYEAISIYFISPIIVILISIYIGDFLRKNALKFYNFITGGR